MSEEVTTSRGAPANWPEVHHRADEGPELALVTWMTVVIVTAGLVALCRAERKK